jgi:drug/metabolite transporter (DMT)-like permease
MLRTLTFGLLIAVLSSAVIGFFLNYFYAFEFDETSKILPISKVVLIYFLLAITFSFLSFVIERKWKNRGLFVLNALISFLAVASMGVPLKYTNTEIDTTFLPIVAIPCLFVLPLIWMSFQPLIFDKK